MWDVCGWSALLVMCVFTPYIHTVGGVNIGVNIMVGGDNHCKSHHHTFVSSTPGHHTDHLGLCGNMVHSCIHSVVLIPLSKS